ncbi:hypothetical protein ACFMQL_05925 [Nonomuraea fastidiosa]|jgi:hypothetical protein
MERDPTGLGDLDDAIHMLGEFVALARRAKESDELLYCWSIAG